MAPVSGHTHEWLHVTCSCGLTCREEIERLTVEIGALRFGSQIDRLARFLLEKFPDEPGRKGSEGAIECAMRLLAELPMRTPR